MQVIVAALAMMGSSRHGRTPVTDALVGVSVGLQLISSFNEIFKLKLEVCRELLALQIRAWSV